MPSARRAARTVSAGARPGRGAGDARTDLHSARSAHARRRALQRALEVRRRLPVPRDDRRRSSTRWRRFADARRLRPGRRGSARTRATPTASTARRRRRWYDWSLRLIEARLATRRGRLDDAVARAEAIVSAATRAAGRHAAGASDRGRGAARRQPLDEAERRLDIVAGRGRPADDAWRVGRVPAPARRVARRARQRRARRITTLAQSSNVFDLLGERYQAARSHLVLGAPGGTAGARRWLGDRSRPAGATFEALGAARDLEDRRRAQALLDVAGHRRVRRLARRCRRRDREAAGRRGRAAGAAGARDASALLETWPPTPRSCSSRCQPGTMRVDRWPGCDADDGPARSRRAPGRRRRRRACCCSTALGADADGPRVASRSLTRARPATSPSAACG